MVLAVVSLVLALTQPRWGYQWEDVHRRGVDIVVALDISNSMRAQDIKPNRLQRAKHEVADLLRMLEGDRIGLVAFAGTAYVQCPLTLDYSAARMFLNAMDMDLLSAQGTALGTAIRKSVQAFGPSGRTSRALVLITDGEDQSGDALEAAQWAAEQGVKIYPIGIGAKIGAPIPLSGPGGGFKKDAQGNVVLTKLDETTLQKIALKTGGTYVRSVTGDLDLEKIYRHNIKQKLEAKEIQTDRRKLWQERFQGFLVLALVFLTAEFLYRERRGTPTFSSR
ncbi:MAG: VWA domain-containing protein [Nitrospinaceae bacterium]|nr:VWA domain-containing protein [Nitrospinaceae bacterium]NIR54492.1 VWA domain-containing protein [Nitrospinaceae bacterium]NIS84911.1 VWA domain-containing protein [Nitrospinaceae bacterium]NIT81725.1 VWA domain-containing protein [Nitrospinaceae bacterium]NIU43994.1 VWA domain-containing protein [Nitrospinaceae bacterium]